MPGPVPTQVVPGFQKIGGTKLGAAALTTSTVSFGNYDILQIVCAITGYAGNDIARLRFNGITTVANYTQRFGYFSTAAAATLATQADNGATNGAILLGQSAVTTARIAVVTINNHVQSTAKPMTVTTVTASSSGTTELNPVVLYSAGQFIAAAATTQITSVVMLTPTSNMNIGTGFVVFGMNLG